jgi:hypothetical protein
MSQAWMCFSGLVLREGTDIKAAEEDWKLSAVAENAAVDIEYDDGEKSFIIIEPDSAIRRLDAESWEPDHPLSRAIMGLKVGDRFTNPTNSKAGAIRENRHKYVAKYYFVLANHESRFPTVGAIRSMSIDPSTPEGIAPILDELKARRDWVEQEQSSYLNGISPLAVLGHRIGSDASTLPAGSRDKGYRSRSLAAANLSDRPR